MPQTFIVDQAATFQAVAFLSAEPKMMFGKDIQETNKEGVPRWELQLVGGFRTFGRVENEVMKVSYYGPKNPAELYGMYTPVQLVNFVVGVMADERTDKRTGEKTIVGARVWYRCDEIRPLHATPPNGK